MGKNDKKDGYSEYGKRSEANTNGADTGFNACGGADAESFAKAADIGFTDDGRGVGLIGVNDFDRGYEGVCDDVAAAKTANVASGYFPTAGYGADMQNLANNSHYGAVTYTARYKNMRKYQRAYNRRGRTALGRAESIWAAMIILMCFAICLLAAFSHGIFGKSADIHIADRQLYAVSGGYFPDVESARRTAAEIIAANGAGYIIEENRQFAVLMSVYTDGADAAKVAENTGGVIYKLYIPVLKLNTGLKSEENNVIKDALSAFNLLIENLINISIKYDKGELNEAETLASVSAQCETLDMHALKIAPFRMEDTEKIAGIAAELSGVSNLLRNIGDLNALKSNTGSAIRNCTIKVIYAQIRLFMKINSL